MATSISVSVEPQTASVLVQVNEDQAAPNLTLTRTDANGTANVRRLAGQVLSGGVLIVRDSEPALTGPVTYTANSNRSGSVAVSATVTLDLQVSFLALPVLPQYRTNPALTTELSVRRESRSTVHQVIGRPDPIVTLAKLGTRSGRMSHVCTSRVEAEQIASIYDRAEVTFFRVPGLSAPDLYHVAQSLDIEQDTELGLWKVTVDYIEVNRPSGPLVGALGWSFANVTAQGSFIAIKQKYATFADLTTGGA